MTTSLPTEHEVAVRVARRLAAGLNELAEVAARGGAAAVAAWACPGGSDEERASVAAYYERLQAQAA